MFIKKRFFYPIMLIFAAAIPMNAAFSEPKLSPKVPDEHVAEKSSQDTKEKQPKLVEYLEKIEKIVNRVKKGVVATGISLTAAAALVFALQYYLSEDTSQTVIGKTQALLQAPEEDQEPDPLPPAQAREPRYESPKFDNVRQNHTLRSTRGQPIKTFDKQGRAAYQIYDQPDAFVYLTPSIYDEYKRLYPNHTVTSKTSRMANSKRFVLIRGLSSNNEIVPLIVETEDFKIELTLVNTETGIIESIIDKKKVLLDGTFYPFPSPDDYSKPTRWWAVDEWQNTLKGSYYSPSGYHVHDDESKVHWNYVSYYPAKNNKVSSIYFLGLLPQTHKRSIIESLYLQKQFVSSGTNNTSATTYALSSNGDKKEIDLNDNHDSRKAYHPTEIEIYQDLQKKQQIAAEDIFLKRTGIHQITVTTFVHTSSATGKKASTQCISFGIHDKEVEKALKKINVLLTNNEKQTIIKVTNKKFYLYAVGNNNYIQLATNTIDGKDYLHFTRSRRRLSSEKIYLTLPAHYILSEKSEDIKRGMHRVTYTTAYHAHDRAKTLLCALIKPRFNS